LIVNEAEGYAFLQAPAVPEENEDPGDETKPPRLVVRRPLSFSVSLFLALLRKRLAEGDHGGGDARLVLTAIEMAEMMRLFLLRPNNVSVR
jgi:hypothetical protein